jgi:hypothetical protein
MNPVKKITRHIIKTEKTPSFLFLGIVSAEPDYRLSVMLNRHLGIDLRKRPDEITDVTGSETHSYSIFTTSPAALSLISNRSVGSTLLKKMKNIDFLLQIHGAPDRKQVEALASSLRIIPEITAVFIFDSREVSDRNIALLGQ